MEGAMTYTQSFFGWLLQTTLIASLIIGLILLIQKILGGKLGPRWCHALWLVLLIRMVLPWAPSSRLSLSNLIPSLERQIQHQQRIEPAEQKTSPPAQITETSEAIPGQESESEVAIQTSVAPKPPPIVHVEGESKLRLASIRRVLPILWLAGAVVIGAYLLMSNFALWRIVKRDRPLVNQEMLELFEECKAQMGIQSLVVVVPSDRIKSPALFGFVRPRLLLPSEMLEKASHEEMRYVFLHELAHLKRCDIYLGWLSSLLQVLHWFNPLVWFAFYRMRSDRELACDALVLARTQKGESQEYGQAIVGLVRRFSRSRPLPAMAGILESKSQLKRRITMIAQFKKNSYRWSPLGVILVIILACISLPDARRSKASGIPAAEPSAIVVRQVWTDTADPQFMGAPSPDGKYLSYVDWETGYLSVHELDTGKNRRLTNKRRSQGFVGNSVFSPDGRQVAYYWWSQEKGSELHIVGLDGSEPRVVNQDEEISIYSRGIYPTGWTPDGKHILALGRKRDRSLEILLVPVADEPVRILKTLGKKLPGGPRIPGLCLSPDGRYVAYTFLPSEESVNRDISVVATDGSHEIPLEKHPADDFVLGWAPDGKRVVFASDRTGSMGIWAIEVTEGKMQGTPQLLKSEVGQFYPLGLTQNGSFYYGIYSGSCNVYTATYDPQKADITAKPIIAVHRYEGSNWAPDWSPDGRYLACISVRPGASPIFLVRSVETGQVRELSPDLKDFNLHSLRWSADGRFLLGSGKTKDVFWGVLKIDVETGEVTAIVEGPGIFGPNWAADGKAVFYVCNLKTNGGIIRHDLATGEKKELYNAPGFISALALSPDGRQLAFHDIQGGALKVLSTTGGELRERVKVEGRITIAWTPDGRQLIYGSRGLGEKPGHLWRISAGGGESQKLDLEMPYLSHVRFRPDGRQVAFTGKVGKDKCEVWVMENFLPAVPLAESEPEPSPSFDGKYMSDVDRDTGNLVIRDIATGEQWNLTKKDPNSGDFAYWSAISPDSTNIIYYWFNAEKEDFDLRVVGLDGSGDRLLWGAREGARSFNMDAWSPDGKYVYGELLGKDEPARLVRVALADGSRQVIKTFDEKRFFTVSSWPDGRYIAYDCAENKSSSRDIFIYDLEENTERPLIRHAANDKLLGWTPDGQHIFFTSDRNGTWDGWLLRVVAGKPDGLPEIIKAGIGDVSPIGFTQSGAFYYALNHEAWNVYTAELDRNTGDVVSEPVPVRLVGKDFCPDFSPDGQYLAYLSQPDRTKPQVIRIRTLATGQERELKPDLPRFERLRWCPDSRHLLITFFRSMGSPSTIYTVDIQTGEYTALARIEDRHIRQAELSADGKTLIYRKLGLGTVTPIIARDMETGSEKEISQLEGSSLAFWSLSPDEKEVAYSIREGGGGDPFVLRIMSVETGESRTLVEDVGFFPVWSSDGRDVFFTRKVNELWRVSAAGSEPRKLLEWKEMIMAPRIHPDGQRIAFHSGGYVSEMWMMENFLPEALGK